jgi:hypothetical protein
VAYIQYYEDKLDLYAVAQHTAPVSSNSPQKRIGFQPTLEWAFFCQNFCGSPRKRHRSPIAGMMHAYQH